MVTAQYVAHHTTRELPAPGHFEGARVGIWLFAALSFMAAAAKANPIVNLPSSYFVRTVPGNGLQAGDGEFAHITSGTSLAEARQLAGSAAIDTTTICLLDCASDWLDGIDTLPASRGHIVGNVAGANLSTAGTPAVMLNAPSPSGRSGEGTSHAELSGLSERAVDDTAFIDRAFTRPANIDTNAAAFDPNSFSSSEMTDAGSYRNMSLDLDQKIVTNECFVGRSANCLVYAESVPALLQWAFGGAVVIALLMLARS